MPRFNLAYYGETELMVERDDQSLFFLLLKKEGNKNKESNVVRYAVDSKRCRPDGDSWKIIGKDSLHPV